MPELSTPLKVRDVVVEPSGIRVSVGAGETLMAAAQRAGFRWPTVCDGEGECGVCFVRITAGGDAVSPADADELRTLTSVYGGRDPLSRRLACALEITGEGVVVSRPGLLRSF